MNILDIRPCCNADCSPELGAYHALQQNRLTSRCAAELLPDRNVLATVWRYLASVPSPIRETPMCLCRKIVRWSGAPLSLGVMLTCLDIFSDVGLLQTQRQHKYLIVRLTPGSAKADLSRSQTMQRLLTVKES